MTEYLQYGALGLLAMVLVGIYQLLMKFLTAVLKGWGNFLDNIQALVSEVKALREKIEKLCDKVDKGGV